MVGTQSWEQEREEIVRLTRKELREMVEPMVDDMTLNFRTILESAAQVAVEIYTGRIEAMAAR